MRTLFCLVVGEVEPFPVRVAANETVGDLKEKIKEETHYTGRAMDLQLYVAVKDNAWLSVDDDDLEGLSQPAEGNAWKALYVKRERKMKATNILSKIFFVEKSEKYPAYCDDDKIHVLVVEPERVAAPLDHQPSKKRKLDDFTNAIAAPSLFAKCRGSDSWIFQLKEFDGVIECHRLPTSDERYLLPLVLLHETFATFESNCKTIAFGKPDCDFFVKFCDAVSGGHEKEETLATAALSTLGHYILSDCPRGASMVPVQVDNSTSDGSYIFDNTLLLNLQVNVQKGDGDGDPTMQNIAYYVKHLPKPIDRVLPCYLLDICGPLLSVFGIVNVTTEYALCEPLVTSIPLLFFDNVGLMTTGVHVCASLKAALRDLTSLYAFTGCDLNPSRFPYHDLAVIDGEKVKIRYCKQLERYVFSAMVVQAGHEVVVKFAKQYGREVHEYCAGHGFAPKLLYFEVLPSNWIFVVMEKLELKPILNALTDAKGDSKVNAKVDAKVIRRQVLEIKNRLAAAKLVHGDLRDANIFWDYTKDRVVLIDFDWSGKEGDTCYPPFMNPDITWPPEAEMNKREKTRFCMGLVFG
ncbi:hypothetical protein AeMF1_006003 [Aphanomyces euteiches]|nr:hypothetical protein AeMF1_006003 [Aphanomyces euteiches]KAH9167742.1 hypothetical protein AeNC1_018085 [Aphanomyces euteiches]